MFDAPSYLLGKKAGGESGAHPDYVLFRDYTGNTLDLSWLRTDNITSFYRMFYSSSQLTSLNLSKFDPRNVTSFEGMFYGCVALETITFSNKIPASEVITLFQMFLNCKAVTELDLTYFLNTTIVGGDTSTVTDRAMQNVFSNCNLAQTIKIPNLKLGSNIKDLSGLFNSCNVLQHLDIRSMEFANITTKTSMLKNVPTNCLIIVKNQTEKSWFATNFPDYTNVQTASEYEANN